MSKTKKKTTKKAPATNKQTKPPKLAQPAAKRLGFSQEESKDIVDNLNILLANYHLFYQKLRNFHWNVVGGDFYDMHEQFELFYTKALENIDEIAERIRVFDATPISNLSEYLKVAAIRETGTDIDSSEMATIILSDMETMIGFFIEGIDSAIAAGDTGTYLMLNTYMKEMEKDHWMLSSFLNKS